MASNTLAAILLILTVGTCSADIYRSGTAYSDKGNGELVIINDSSGFNLTKGSITRRVAVLENSDNCSNINSKNLRNLALIKQSMWLSSQKRSLTGMIFQSEKNSAERDINDQIRLIQGHIKW